MPLDPTQFFGLPGCNLQRANVVILPLPLEKTVSYGTGTCGGPEAILNASCQLELFDEETLVDFSEGPKIHTLPPLAADGTLEEYLAATKRLVAAHRGRFLLALGGEHTASYGVIDGLADDLGDVTVVQIDAHADLINQLTGRRWSHGTVMRRLWERGCRLLQVGIRSLSREEYELVRSGPRISTYFAHQLAPQWDRLLAELRGLAGKVYLSINVDGLDPAVFPSTGTPQPGGLSWQQTMQIIRAVAESSCQWVGADVMELVASPHPPGCDITAARLAAKVLAWREAARKAEGGRQKAEAMPPARLTPRSLTSCSWEPAWILPSYPTCLSSPGRPSRHLPCS